ncbi:MAG: glycosyltransferase [Burkholderiaceae bacterium]
MKIILFCHPFFMRSQSMPRFAKMLKDAYEKRGHDVTVWSPSAIARQSVESGALGKWAGYIDQYFFFPRWVRKALRRQPVDTLFVFCDQALGPWVPLVKHRPHVIHCHDFLALRSALGEFPQHRIRWSGRVYQHYIRRGFSHGQNFICVSRSTQEQLENYLHKMPALSKVVHNGLNYDFAPLDATTARSELADLPVQPPPTGMLVHVGGNTWYKNRCGVLRIYAAYCQLCTDPLPLWMVGDAPSAALLQQSKTIAGKAKIHFLSGLSNRQVQAAYSLARALVFPSIAEGFGWPIAEAMACGCPVLTTGESPMTEVGGVTAYYVPVMPYTDGIDAWADTSAQILMQLLNENDLQRESRRMAGLTHVQQFSADKAIDAYENIYEEVMAQFRHISDCRE